MSDDIWLCGIGLIFATFVAFGIHWNNPWPIGIPRNPPKRPFTGGGPL